MANCLTPIVTRTYPTSNPVSACEDFPEWQDCSTCGTDFDGYKTTSEPVSVCVNGRKMIAKSLTTDYNKDEPYAGSLQSPPTWELLTMTQWMARKQDALTNCAGTTHGIGASVPSCDEMTAAIAAAVAGVPTVDITGKQDALVDCAGVAHGIGASVPSCAELETERARITALEGATPATADVVTGMSFDTPTSTLSLTRATGAPLTQSLAALAGGGTGAPADGVVTGGSVTGTTLTLERSVGADVVITGLPSGGGTGGTSTYVDATRTLTAADGNSVVIPDDVAGIASGAVTGTDLTLTDTDGNDVVIDVSSLSSTPTGVNGTPQCVNSSAGSITLTPGHYYIELTTTWQPNVKKFGTIFINGGTNFEVQDYGASVAIAPMYITIKDITSGGNGTVSWTSAQTDSIVSMCFTKMN